MDRTERKRPWLAAVLAFVHPGLGHVYLREWLRAILWFGTVVAAMAFFIPEGITPETVTVQSIMDMYSQFPMEAMIAMTVITAMSMVDAYSIATQRNEQQRRTEAGARCPSCGRDVDEDIDFCHWCTTELDTDDSEEPTRA